MAKRGESLGELIKTYLCTAMPKAWTAAGDAIASATGAVVIALARALAARTNPPTNTLASPGQERHRFDERRNGLLGGPTSA